MLVLKLYKCIYICIYIVFKILQVFDGMMSSPAENNEIMPEPPVVLIILNKMLKLYKDI